MATMQKMLIHNSKVQASELRKVWLLRCEQLAGMVVPDLIKMQEMKVPNSFQKERSHSVGCRAHANCTCDVQVFSGVCDAHLWLAHSRGRCPGHPCCAEDTVAWRLLGMALASRIGGSQVS